MNGDFIVKDQVVDQSSRLSTRGETIPVMRVRFSLGDHGPFSLYFDLADFTPENVKAAQAKLAATLKGI